MKQLNSCGQNITGPNNNVWNLLILAQIHTAAGTAEVMITVVIPKAAAGQGTNDKTQPKSYVRHIPIIGYVSCALAAK